MEEDKNIQAFSNAVQSMFKNGKNICTYQNRRKNIS